MNYFGAYEDFELSSEESPGAILSADNAVGDIYDIDLNLDNGLYTAWLVNKFNQRIGYFNSSFSHKLALMSAEGMTLKAILSFIAYTADNSKAAKKGTNESVDYSDYGRYWGNAAVICFNENNSEAFGNYIQEVASSIADDVRPNIDLSDETAVKIQQSNGDWLPKQNISLPDTKEGMTFIKRRRRLMERVVDQGRARNKGCYVVSWAFIIIVIAAVVLSIKSCAGL